MPLMLGECHAMLNLYFEEKIVDEIDTKFGSTLLESILIKL